LGGAVRRTAPETWGGPDHVIAINRSSWSLAVKTVFFAPEPARSDSAADLIGCVQSTRADEGFQVVRTLHIDLTHTPTRLFSALGKSTKNQVNRAEKRDQLTSTVIAQPADDDICAFRDFYNEFARAKGTTLCRGYQMETMRLLMRQNGLVITRIADAHGQPLCYHVYVADGARAMLLYSASHFRRIEDQAERKRLGRANRLLHWRDILFFQAQGYAIYDFGGLTDDPRIAEFKRSFGGDEVAEYTGYVPVTWKGRAAAAYRGILCTLRRQFFSPPEMR
jgi:hypothetical protein